MYFSLISKESEFIAIIHISSLSYISSVDLDTNIFLFLQKYFCPNCITRIIYVRGNPGILEHNITSLKCPVRSEQKI